MELISLIQDLKGFLATKLSLQKLSSSLKKFQVENENAFDFAAVNMDNLTELTELLLKVIHNQTTSETRESKEIISNTIKSSLGCLKIISRSKECVYILSQNEKSTFSILSIAKLNQDQDTNNIEIDDELQLEAMRIISNCLFHSKRFRQIFIEKHGAKHITNHLAETLGCEFSDKELTFVQVKVLFLISALEYEVRERMNNEYNTLDILVKMLEECLKKKSLLGSTTSDTDSSERAKTTDLSCKLSDNEIQLFSEILKTLFNISVNACDENSRESSSSEIYKRLSVVLHCFLTKCTSAPGNLDMLLGHLAHLIINIPKLCLDDLIPRTRRRKWEEPIPKIHGYPIEYELRDMSAVITLVIALDKELKEDKKQQEGCSKVFSILTSLCHVCRCLRLVRKYLRLLILPPLKDASVRPELSDSLKGRLVKSMTHVDTNIKNMAADFLFVLCKENVDRLVKYTGYGNAAGLLAARGLIGKSKVPSTGDYSSDDSDSETEEYVAVANKIDAMTGAVKDKPVDDPMKGMTDDEKQANAEELMGLMDKLTSLNVIKPMRIDADGHPQEVTDDEVKEYLKKKIDTIDK